MKDEMLTPAPGVPMSDEAWSPSTEIKELRANLAAEREARQGLEEALRGAEWNAQDGFDPNSPLIVSRHSWQRIRAALAYLPNDTD